MTVDSVSGDVFVQKQTNEVAQNIGVQTMYGGFIENGSRAVILNVGSLKEVWDCMVYSDRLECKYNGFSMLIKEKKQIVKTSQVPFNIDDVMNWSTSANQSGKLTVTSIDGASFTLDQNNEKNISAGTTKLTGEVKNGKIYFYDRQWNETWEGTLSGSTITGMVDTYYTFTVEGVSTSWASPK